MRFDLTRAEIDAIYHEVRFGGMAQIRNERERQKHGEGYDYSHDDEHLDGSLAAAATAYVLREPNRWPWSNEIKLGPNRQRELVKAGALYRAEADRLQRIVWRYEAILFDLAKEIDALDEYDERQRAASKAG